MSPAVERRVVANGVSLWATTQGDGPPVVLCHGGPGLYDYLEPVASMIDDLVTVHRYDQRGCGRSDDSGPYDIAAFLGDLDALRVHWGHEAWTVIGHSWGATLALLYAIQHPRRVRRLVYMSGTGVDPAWHADYRRNREARLSPAERSRLRGLERRRATASGADLDRINEERAAVLDASEYYDPARFDERPRYDRFPVNYQLNSALNAEVNRIEEAGRLPEQISRISMPVLVLDGEADPRPRWAREQVARLIPGSRHVTIEQAGHDPWVERPEATAAAIRDFLNDTA